MAVVLDWVEQTPERHYVDWKVFRLLVWMHPHHYGKWLFEVGAQGEYGSVAPIFAHYGGSISDFLPYEEAAKEAAERAAREVGIAIPEADS